MLTRLERRYAEFDGLNLTWETLEGTVKHNGPLAAPARSAVPPTIAEYDRRHDLALATWPSAEAQVAALADDIAYNNHDIDDGLRAGLFAVADLADVPLVGPVFAEVAARYPGLEEPRLIHEAIRRLIDRMVGDLVAETRRRLAESADRDRRRHPRARPPVVAFSEAMRANDRALQALPARADVPPLPREPHGSKARRIVRELFELFLAEPRACRPNGARWRPARTTAETARVVADYIAGMTDRFALDEHFRLFDRYALTT